LLGRQDSKDFGVAVADNGPALRNLLVHELFAIRFRHLLLLQLLERCEDDPVLRLAHFVANLHSVQPLIVAHFQELTQLPIDSNTDDPADDLASRLQEVLRLKEDFPEALDLCGREDLLLLQLLLDLLVHLLVASRPNGVNRFFGLAEGASVDFPRDWGRTKTRGDGGIQDQELKNH
jgi:hypothetical protein